MLPGSGTTGETKPLLKTVLRCPKFWITKRNISGSLARVPGGIDNGSGRWHAACRARANALITPNAEPSIGHADRKNPLVEYRGLEDWKCPLSRCAGIDTISVALGKFDAMHIGHRKLASRAAELGGQPWLVSFSGMADVLGWPKRPPLVADADRVNVLASWAPHCNGVAPCQRFIPFAEVRSLSPEAFVHVLAHDLKVSGIVVGEGFRFGYKAAGDTQMLQQLGAALSVEVSVVSLVSSGCTEDPETVSSSAVRSALAEGRMGDVRCCLDRPYTLLFQLAQGLPQAFSRCCLPASDCQNQLPGNGVYNCTVSFLREGTPLSMTAALQIAGACLHVSGTRVELELPVTADLPASNRSIVCVDL